MWESRSAPGFCQRFKKSNNKHLKKKTKNRGREEENEQKEKLDPVATMRKTWQILSNRCNLCLLIFCKKK